MEKIKRQLAAVRVAGQHQVEAKFHRLIEVVGVVIQQNVDGSRHHQTLDYLIVRLAVIDANFQGFGTSVLEPGTLALLCAGLLAIGVKPRRIFS